jgi:uncharacterized protein (TIGR02246 family)
MSIPGLDADRPHSESIRCYLRRIKIEQTGARNDHHPISAYAVLTTAASVGDFENCACLSLANIDRRKEISMKPATLVALLIPALSIAEPAAARAPPSCNASSTADIERQFAKFNAAWSTKDPDKVTALFTHDAVLLATVSNLPRTDPGGVRDYFVTFLKQSPSARIDTSTIKLDCNTASRVGTWTVTLKDNSGASQDLKARYSFVYRYDRGGWKIDHLHSSLMPEKPEAK